MRLVKLLLAIAILAGLFHVAHGQHSYLQTLARLDVVGIVLILALITADRILMTFKWLRLVATQTRPPGLWLATRIYCASMLLGMLLPSTVGADTLRVIALQRHGHDASVLLSSIVVERLFGLATTVALGTAGLFLLPADALGIPYADILLPLFALTASALLVVTAVAAMPLLRRAGRALIIRVQQSRAGPLLARIHTSLAQYRHHPLVLVEFLLLTVVEQLLTAAVFWMIASELGVHIGFFEIFMATMVAFMLSRIPLTPGGLGVFEGVFSLFLVPFGVLAADALVIALLARVLELVAWSPWWFWHSFAQAPARPDEFS